MVGVKKRPVRKFNLEINLNNDIEDKVRSYIISDRNKMKEKHKQRRKKKIRRRIKMECKISSFVFPNSNKEKKLRLSYINKFIKKKKLIKQHLKEIRERIKHFQAMANTSQSETKENRVHLPKGEEKVWLPTLC
ncbi:hypothetical protein, conserved [Plasmodium vivax]|uniref:Uncharacterized protein n=1 Tax=Plasmodium vivax (strain Salvador I) TaxID=126793 RepID=A5K355_PLAVS|nr:hypothetical protein, conserved [Plasmodium vivax]EDL45959.1 hypothetical protein, conserved [Plasmodium vivax]|eukprot:XP_001615686.1 hypothetical protein [Plasmodium vivax Sal-1]